MNFKKLFYDKKKRENKTTIRLLGIPVYKCRFDNDYRKKYLFGILVSKQLTLKNINKGIKDIHESIKNINERIEGVIPSIKTSMSSIEKEMMTFNAIRMCYESEENNVEKNAIFLAGSGAVAEFAVQNYSYQPDFFDIFADVSSFAEWNNLRSLHKNAHKIIFPMSSFKRLSKIRKYKNKIFVLGDSYHHSEVLKLACETKEEANRWYILPEPFLFDLFSFYIKEDFVQFAIKYYPNLKKEMEVTKDIALACIKNNICFCRPLVELTGIKNFILYSEKNLEVFLSEGIEDKDIRTFTVPMPCQKICHQDFAVSKFDFKDSDYLIGSFGLPSDYFKKTRLLIEAVHLLNQKEHINVKLLIAGLSADEYKKSIPDELKETTVFMGNISPNDWLSLLNYVDFGVQLREHAFSFSSGCVAELLGIGKRVLVTKGMVEPEWEKEGAVRFVDEGLNVEEIAQILKEEIQNKHIGKIPDELYQNYSFEKNCSRIKSILENNS